MKSQRLDALLIGNLFTETNGLLVLDYSKFFPGYLKGYTYLPLYIPHHAAYQMHWKEVNGSASVPIPEIAPEVLEVAQTSLPRSLASSQKKLKDESKTLGYPKWVPRLIPVPLSILGLSLILGCSSPPPPLLDTPTEYVTKGKEDVRAIAKTYGVPAPAIMIDNNLTSYFTNPEQKLVINPVVEPKRIPKEVGKLLYSNLGTSKLPYPGFVHLINYEDAYIADITGDKRPEIVVLVSQEFFRSRTATTLFLRGYDGETPFTKRATIVTFIILDSTSKKLFEQTTFTEGGFNNYLYPLGDGKQFFWHTTKTKEWFAPWMYRDVERAIPLEISPLPENKFDIQTVMGRRNLSPHLESIEGRKVKIRKENDGRVVVIGNYFHYDVRNHTPDNYPYGARFKRVEYLNGRFEVTNNEEFFVGELTRMLFENELSRDDIRFLVRKHPNEFGRAVDLIRKTQKNGERIVGIVASEISAGRDPIKEVGKVFGLEDGYTISVLLDKQINPYLFTVNEQTERLEPLTFELYRRESRIVGVLPHERRLIAIFDPEARDLALQGGLYLGKESPLGIELKLSRSIDATAQPINTNLVVIDKRM